METQTQTVYKIKSKNIIKWPFRFKQISPYFYIEQNSLFVVGRVQIGDYKKWMLVDLTSVNPGAVSIQADVSLYKNFNTEDAVVDHGSSTGVFVDVNNRIRVLSSVYASTKAQQNFESCVNFGAMDLISLPTPKIFFISHPVSFWDESEPSNLSECVCPECTRITDPYDHYTYCSQCGEHYSGGPIGEEGCLMCEDGSIVVENFECLEGTLFDGVGICGHAIRNKRFELNRISDIIKNLSDIVDTRYDEKVHEATANNTKKDSFGIVLPHFTLSTLVHQEQYSANFGPGFSGTMDASITGGISGIFVSDTRFGTYTDLTNETNKFEFNSDSTIIIPGKNKVRLASLTGIKPGSDLYNKMLDVYYLIVSRLCLTGTYRNQNINIKRILPFYSYPGFYATTDVVLEYVEVVYNLITDENTRLITQESFEAEGVGEAISPTAELGRFESIAGVSMQTLLSGDSELLYSYTGVSQILDALKDVLKHCNCAYLVTGFSLLCRSRNLVRRWCDCEDQDFYDGDRFLKNLVEAGEIDFDQLVKQVWESGEATEYTNSYGLPNCAYKNGGPGSGKLGFYGASKNFGKNLRNPSIRGLINNGKLTTSLGLSSGGMLRVNILGHDLVSTIDKRMESLDTNPDGLGLVYAVYAMYYKLPFAFLYGSRIPDATYRVVYYRFDEDNKYTLQFHTDSKGKFAVPDSADFPWLSWQPGDQEIWYDGYTTKVKLDD